jgi:hypothetical protein
MAYRGRLIKPIMVEICRLDLAATQFDQDFREPALVSSADRLGAPDRKEMAAFRIPAQVDNKFADRLTMAAAGDLKQTFVVLILHFMDIEAMNLVHPTTGQCLLKSGDRLAGLYQENGSLIQTYPSPPGVFVRESTPVGIGLGGQRNLLRLICQSRDQGI